MSSFPARLLRRIVMASAILIAASQAALDFHTYRIVRERVRDEAGRDSLRVSYVLTRLGPVTLEASTLRVTSHGSYLSIVEEATLTGNVADRPRDITGDFLLQGSLPVPPLAAVHGLSALHGDTLFQAGLKKAAYSLNDLFFDTLALASTLDNRVAFLQQLADRSFEAAFTRLSLGEPVRVRIAYELPFPGAPGSTLRVPVLFHPSGNPPGSCQVTFFERAEGLPPLQMLLKSGRVGLDHSGTHTVEYQAEYQFRRDEPAGSVASLQTTALETGTRKGNYLLFNAGLSDSLMDELSRPLEAVFLWRWNPPYGFVEVRNGLKTLSPLGETVVREAGLLRDIISAMGPRGHRFGLLHSEPGKEVRFFPSAEAGADGHASLLAYLETFSAQRLFAEYKDYKDDRPAWAITPWTDSGETARSGREFLSALERIRRGFGDRPEALRHVEMLGFGSVEGTLIDLEDPREVEAVLGDATLANANAAWLGVDLAAIARLEANASLRPLAVDGLSASGLPPLLFPVFQPTTVEYRAFSDGRSHAVVMPFHVRAERRAAIKSAGTFHDSLQLQGMDALGRKTRILSLQPRMLSRPADTGLARLWAADPDRISEAGEVDLGMRYGILTKGTYWGACVEDAFALEPEAGNPVGIGSLPRQVRGGGLRTPFRVLGNHLLIADPGATAGPGVRDADRRASGLRLHAYDLRGRLLLDLDLSAFRRDGGFAVPMELLRRLAQARVALVLRGARVPVSFTLTLGGRP